MNCSRLFLVLMLGLAPTVAWAQPANDDCTDASVATLGSNPFDTYTATTDGMELDPAVCDPGYYGNDQIYNDVWFTYTADCSGTLTISLCDSNYDTRIAVYDNLDCPADPHDVVACNDDATFGSCAWTLKSIVELDNVATGETFLIRVGGFSSSSKGAGNMHITCSAPPVVPVNDDCAHAEEIPGGLTDIDTRLATTDGAPLNRWVCDMGYFGDEQIYNDIWFTYTAECDGALTISLCDSEFDTRLAVYDTVICPADPHDVVGCDDDAGLGSLCVKTYQSEVRIPNVSQGEQFLIRVGGFSHSSDGLGQILIDCAAPNDGLVGHWRMDETSGHVVEDTSGMGHHGYVIGCPEWDANGQVEGAINFERNGSIKIPAEAFESIDAEATITTWVFGGESQPQAGFLFHGTSRFEPWLLGSSVPWSDSRVYFDSGQWPADQISTPATADEIRGSWRHWAFTKNANTGEMKIYLDGELWYSETGKTQLMGGITRFRIAAKTNGWRKMDARVDDFRVYNRELGEEEIEDIFDGQDPMEPSLPPFSDDFSDPQLQDFWTFEDPIGDCSFNLVGSGTFDAQLEIFVPGGIAHDAFNENNSARVLQATEDGDFEISAKYDSEPTVEFQSQGLLIEQDADNWIRFDFVGRTDGLYIFAGITTDGDTDSQVFSNIASSNGAPLYNRINRTGDTWTLDFSYNNVVWNNAVTFDHSMIVTRSGVFAGNQGSFPPAFTAKFDYFFNNAAPIDAEDGEVIIPPDPGTSGFESDDFNTGNALSSVWTTIDPLGDATFEVVGGGTADAQLQISVPGGVAHDAFGENEAPRVLQTIQDTDFEFEAKFDTSPMLEFQVQGILIEQDPLNWLRFDFVGTDQGLRIFAGITIDGSTSSEVFEMIPSGQPQYMRITRSGNTWTQAYSFDGVNYTTSVVFDHTLITTAAGVFAGNAGSGAPAFTANIDYMFDTSNPIVPEDGTP